MEANSTTIKDETPTTAPVKAMFICLIAAWVLFLIPVTGLGVIGWVLTLAAFIISIICMSKSETAKGVAGLILSLVASPVVYAIGFYIQALIFVNKIH